MSVQLMTGNTTVPVPSASDGALYAGIIGAGTYVQDVGKKCAATLDGPNKLVVQNGSIVHNGRHIRLLGNTEFTIPSGLQAQKRSNLAIIRYKSEPDGGESVEHLVLTGAAVTDGEPPDPELNTGSILDGATVSDIVLYRVVTDGINAMPPEPLFNVMLPMSELWDSKSQQRFVPFASSIAARGYVVVKLPAVNGYRVCACTMEANEIGNTAPYLTSPNVFIDGSGSVRIINANDYSGSISGTVVCRYLKV